MAIFNIVKTISYWKKGTVKNSWVSFLDTSAYLKRAAKMRPSGKLALGKRIRAAREFASQQAENFISPEALAAKLHWFPRRIWEIENGILGVDSTELISIGRALGVHPGGFFDDRSWLAWQAISNIDEASLIVAKTLQQTDPFSRKVLEKVIAHASIQPLTFV